MTRKQLAALAFGALAAAGCSQVFTTDIPLRVVSVTPGGQKDAKTGLPVTVGVARSSSVVILFSEDISDGTDASKIIVQDVTAASSTPTAVQGTLSYSTANSQFAVTFQPQALLPYSHDFQVVVTGGASGVTRKRDGGHLPFTVNAWFSTVDPAPLVVVATHPGNGATGVDRTVAIDPAAPITVTFSEPPSCASLAGNVSLTMTPDPFPTQEGTTQTVAGSFTCVDPSTVGITDPDPTACAKNPQLCTLPFVPTNKTFLFGWSSQVALVLTGGPKGIESARATARGGWMASNVTVDWQSRNPPPFALVSAAPGPLASGAPGVNQPVTVQLRFSEAIDGTTDFGTSGTGGLVVVTATGPVHGTPPNRSPAGQTATITGTWGFKPALTPPSNALLTDDPAQGAYRCDVAADGTPAADDPCTATFTTTSKVDWSSVVSVSLPGGGYTTTQPVTTLTYVQGLRATRFGGYLPSSVASVFRVQDPPPLTVAETLPGDGATGVSLAATTGGTTAPPITVTFDQDISSTSATNGCNPTLNSTTVVVTEQHYSNGALTSAAPLAASLSCTAGTLTIQPTSAYLYSQTVTVKLVGLSPYSGGYPTASIESDIATDFGGQLSPSVSFSFQTQNPPPLLVVSTTPGSGEIGADPTASSVKVQFNQPLNCAAVTTSDLTFSLTAWDQTVSGGAYSGRHAPPIALPSYAAAPGCASLACDPSDATNKTLLCALTPAALALPESADVTATLSGVSSTSATPLGGQLTGNAAGGAYQWGYRTSDPLPLTVESSSPSDQGLQAGATGTVVVHLTRPVDCSSVSGNGNVGAPPTPSIAIVETPSGGTATPLSNVVAQCGVDGSGNPDPTQIVITHPQFTYGATEQVTVLQDPSLPPAVAGPATPSLPAGGLRAADWNDYGGTLSANFVFSFQIEPEPLQVVSTVPTAGAVNVPATTLVTITWNQPVNPLTIVTSGSGADIKAVNVTNGNSACTVSVQSVDPTKTIYTLLVTDPQCTPGNNGCKTGFHLVPTDQYLVTIIGGAGSASQTVPVGTDNVSFLPANDSFGFTITSAAILAGTTPTVSQTGVALNSPICAIFTDTIDQSTGGATPPAGSVAATFTDSFGETTNVQGTLAFATMPYPGQPAPNTDNAICLTPTPSTYDCLDEPALLVAATGYSASVTGLTVGGTGLPGGTYAWGFTTAADPSIAEVSAQNSVLFGTGRGASSRADLYCTNAALCAQVVPAGTIVQDIPINSTFKALFTSSLASASVTSANAFVRPTPTQATPSPTAVAANVTLGADGVTITVAPTALLPYASSYQLVLRGGATGLTTSAGNNLASDHVFQFVTSPAAVAAISPPAGSTFYPTQAVPFTLTRKAFLPSLQPANIYTVDFTATGCPTGSGGRLPGIIATNSDVPNAGVLVNSPTFLSGGSADVVVSVGVLDYRGNPLPAAASPDPNAADASASVCNAVNNTAPASNALKPSALVAGTNIATATPEADQPFVLDMGSQSASNSQRFEPTSFFSVPGGNGGTVVLQALSIANPGGTTCPTVPVTGEGKTIDVSTNYLIGQGGADDKVQIWPSTPLQAGQSYCLFLGSSYATSELFFSNVYSLGIVQTPAPMVLLYPGETTAPTSTGVQVFSEASQSLIAASGATGVQGNSPIDLQFSESVELTSLSDGAGGSVVFKDTTAGKTLTGGSFSVILPASYPSLGGPTIAYQPAAHLVSGHSYSIGLTTGVKDLAGNSLAAATTPVSFEADTTAPTANTALATAGTNANPQTLQWTVTLNEPIDPATVTTDLFSTGGGVTTPGSVTLVDSNGQHWELCAGVSFVNGDQVTVSPNEKLPSGKYTLTLGSGSKGVADYAGNSLTAAATYAITL
ncbi:MAG: Ig-like domain-containing protein [Deltaproteobacteria bacterium]